MVASAHIGVNVPELWITCIGLVGKGVTPILAFPIKGEGNSLATDNADYRLQAINLYNHRKYTATQDR